MRSQRNRIFGVGVLLAAAVTGCGTQHVGGSPPSPAVRTSWHYASGPRPGPSDGAFTVSALAAISAGDVWAVGETNGGPNKGGDGDSGTLAFHYDGKAWTRLTPPGTKAQSLLYDVTATSGSDVWAVGSDAGGLLVDHYDGRRWTALHPAGTGVAEAVAAVSPDDLWVAGVLNPGFKCSSAGCVNQTADDRPVLLHFDGTRWRRAGGLLDTDVHAVVTSMAARGPDDVWAAGSWQVTPHTPEGEQPLVAHWDGRQWSRADLPEPQPGPARVERVVTAGRDEAWATGSYGDRQGIADLRPYVLHFDGTRWLRVPTGGLTAPLAAVAPDGHGGLWATDDTVRGGSALLRHFDGATWTSAPVNGTPKGTVWAPIADHGGVLWAAGQSSDGGVGFASSDR